MREWTDQAVRCTVIELLKDFNQSKLAQISPLSQSMISYIANAKYKAAISNDKCEEFGKWYQTFITEKVKSPQVIEPCNSKVNFHPVQEVPLLREWYRESQHPPEGALQRYRDILNTLAIRNGPKKPVELMHLKNWWKNERAKHKKNALLSMNAGLLGGHGGQILPPGAPDSVKHGGQVPSQAPSGARGWQILPPPPDNLPPDSVKHFNMVADLGSASSASPLASRRGSSSALVDERENDAGIPQETFIQDVNEQEEENGGIHQESVDFSDLMQDVIVKKE